MILLLRLETKWNEIDAVVTALQPVRCGKKPPVWLLGPDYSLCGWCCDGDCMWGQLAWGIVSSGQTLKLQAGKVEFPCTLSQGTALSGHQSARSFTHLLQTAPRHKLNSICWIMKTAHRAMGSWGTILWNRRGSQGKRTHRTDYFHTPAVLGSHFYCLYYHTLHVIWKEKAPGFISLVFRG